MRKTSLTGFTIENVLVQTECIGTGSKDTESIIWSTLLSERDLVVRRVEVQNGEIFVSTEPIEGGMRIGKWY